MFKCSWPHMQSELDLGGLSVLDADKVGVAASTAAAGIFTRTIALVICAVSLAVDVAYLVSTTRSLLREHGGGDEAANVIR